MTLNRDRELGEDLNEMGHSAAVGGLSRLILLANDGMARAHPV